jgi:hypothetical protein
MTDLADDASGPALSEPAGITQQVKQPASSDRGKLRVFISYSRDDLNFADQVDAAFNACSFECLIDRHGISGGEDTIPRQPNQRGRHDRFRAIAESAGAETCAWGVEEMARLPRHLEEVLSIGVGPSGTPFVTQAMVPKDFVAVTCRELIDCGPSAFCSTVCTKVL